MAANSSNKAAKIARGAGRGNRNDKQKASIPATAMNSPTFGSK
jgi:hypothetical protein